MTMIGYVTTAQLAAYADARAITLTQDESVLLTRALDWLELQVFAGTKTDPAQPLEWPRTGIPGVDPATVPDKIKTAQMVCALIYHAGGDPLAAITPRVTQETVFGAVSVSYSDSGPSTPLYPQLAALIRPYLTAGSMGGANFRVQRA